jgi:cation diffusion facilitator CzcD-associated flavoprotein CzcO
MSSSQSSDEVDVVVVGAGLSGVAAGHYLRAQCPDRSFVMLEGRAAIGGTWDLFRYPGVRSDSDMFTLGYTFRPWTSDAAIAEGRPSGTTSGRRLGKRACWTGSAFATGSSPPTGMATPPAGPCRSTRPACRRSCAAASCSSAAATTTTSEGHEPELPGRSDFTGRIVHPQQWPEGLDYAGQRVVVIGSGATAITLVPSLAQKAAHVTMLQRSPSYILAIPGRDGLGRSLQRLLPRKLAYRLIRWKNILLSTALFQFARRRPEALGRWLVQQAHRRSGVALEHLQPRYAPWDQRLCIAPDADVFGALRSGRASIATGQVAAFTPRGVRLASGEELPADIVVLATGLQLQLFGGARITWTASPCSRRTCCRTRG